jgi:RNA polymerase sigma-70 factor (ECF subfamily)
MDERDPISKAADDVLGGAAGDPLDRATGDVLAARFEAHRARLRALAYQTLGSTSEADDAVQEAWLRLSRSDAGEIGNLGGWLTTVVARVCLNMLAARREEPVGMHLSESVVSDETGVVGLAWASGRGDPEREALLADSIGPALLVILHTLAPAERLAFVLHDMFAIPFDDIAPVVGRTPAAARQLASRARRRVQGAAPVLDTDLTRQRAIVDAFLAAARKGDFDALLEALDPDVVVRSNGTELVFGDAASVARRALAGARYAQVSLPALVNGKIGFVMATEGWPLSLMAFTITNAKIVAVDLTDTPARIAETDLNLLDRPLTSMIMGQSGQ